MRSTRPCEARTKAGRLRNALRCAAFLILAACLFVPTSYVLRNVPFRYSKGTFPAFYAEERDSLDVVTFGSSGCYQFFDTPLLYENFGLTSFNLSVPLMPASAVPFLMDEAEKHQSPELYVVEVRCYLRNPGKDPDRALYLLTDSMDYGRSKWRMLLHSYGSYLESVKAYFDIWKYHGYLPEVTGEALSYFDNRKKSALKTWRNRAIVHPQETPISQEDIGPLALDPRSEAELRFLLDECRRKGRRVLFVATPHVYTRKYVGRKKALAELIAAAGFPFLDLTEGEAYGLDYRTDFWDHRHVNYHGAEKVTNALGEYIQKEYNIRTEHTEAVTADWEACVRSNHDQIRELEEKERKTKQ